jgi:hypothetical protein
MKHHAIKIHYGVDAYLLLTLTSEPEGNKWSDLDLGLFTPGNDSPGSSADLDFSIT